MLTQDMVRMANQIAVFFRAYPEDEAVREVANHLTTFWDPRMRASLDAHVAQGAANLDPLVLRAVQGNVAARVVG